jgi:DNA-binding response OmpR family regulator
LTQLKVVIIEDSQDVASYLALAIQTLGHETAIAYDGATAFSLLHQATPDLILLDMQLPDINGDAILQHVRGNAQLKYVPVVVLTGESSMLNKEVEKLANLVLVKPIDFHVLSQLIGRITKTS